MVEVDQGQHQKTLKHSKHLHLCSEDEWKSDWKSFQFWSELFKSRTREFLHTLCSYCFHSSGHFCTFCQLRSVTGCLHFARKIFHLFDKYITHHDRQRASHSQNKDPSVLHPYVALLLS